MLHNKYICISHSTNECFAHTTKLRAPLEEHVDKVHGLGCRNEDAASTIEGLLKQQEGGENAIKSFPSLHEVRVTDSSIVQVR